MEFFDFNNINLYASIILSIINGILMCFVGYKFLQILQLSNYKSKGYWHWLKDTKERYASRIFMLTLLSTACILVTNFLLDTNNLSVFWSYIGLIFYFSFVSIFIVNLYNAPKKTPLKMTNRMNRLRFVVGVLMSLCTFGLIALATIYVPQYRFGVVALTPLLLIVLVPFANWIMSPFEKINSLRYVRIAKKKLNSRPDLIKIALTGSYGKTSTKLILKTILSEKYSVCESPLNYNTPMGLTKTITQYLDFNHQIFIAEMGARYKGDIKELCELVQPQYGILLSIGNQHLQTFGSLDKIISTKKELADYLEQNNGTLVCDGNNKESFGIFQNFNGEKYLANGDNKIADIFADGIQCSTSGTEFDLYFKLSKNVVKCKTILLGEHNVENIVCAATLALKLGLTEEEICRGITKIQQIEHRLQLVRSKDMNIIDDSYNGSVGGAKSALKVLKMFDGNKIVVTPGVVELGELEKDANVNFGKDIAKVADKVIIVNVLHSADIKNGLLESGFNEENIIQVDNLKNAQEMLKRIVVSNSTILFYNDLPDNYI